MKKLSWLKVGQHQFQKNVTHRLTLVLVDGRDNECVFSCLIGVFLLAVTSSIASSTKLLAQSIPCFVSDCRGHVSTPKSRGYRKSNRELPFPAFGASFLRFFRLFLNFIHYTTKSLFWTFPYEKVCNHITCVSKLSSKFIDGVAAQPRPLPSSRRLPF